jgi:hypothetical protein
LEKRCRIEARGAHLQGFAYQGAAFRETDPRVGIFGGFERDDIRDALYARLRDRVAEQEQIVVL